MAGDLVDRMSVDGNGSSGHIIKSHQQVDKSSFTASGRSDDRDTFTRLCMEIEVFDKLLVRNIAEADIVDIDFTFNIGNRFLRIFAFRFFFQKCEDSGGAGKCVLKFCDNGTDIIEWFHVLVRIGEQYRKSADSQNTARNHKGTDQSYTCVDDIVYETGRWVGQTAVEDSFLAAFL